MDFNFDAFDVAPPFIERLRQKHGWYLAAGVIGTLVLVLAGVVVYFLTHDWIASLMPWGVMALVLGAITAGEYRSIGRAIQLTHFASKNNLTYRHDAPFDSRDGLIFRDGHNKKFVDILTARQRSFAEIGTYQYETGSGKSRQTHSYGYVRLKLPRRLPNMVLDAKSNNMFGRISNLPSSFRRDEVMHLEGDFDKYFTLYAPAQYKTDALYVFTPDVMQTLIDTVGEYDCEVIDDDFYIYTQPKFTLTDRKHFMKIISIARALKPELLKQSENYRDDAVGNRAANSIAPAGARLKTRMSTAMIIVIVIFVVYFGLQIFSGFMSVR